MHFYCAVPAHSLYLTAFFTIITNISCYPVHYPLPHAQMSSIDALYCTCVFLFVFLYVLFFIYMMPGSKGLNPHELAHKWMKDLGTRPNINDVTGLLHCYAVPAILIILLEILIFLYKQILLC